MTSLNQLIDYHAAGEKDRDQWRVGTEHEKFVFSHDFRPLHYQGDPAAGLPNVGIYDLLKSFETEWGWEPLEDEGYLIALEGPDGSIALEPGGQIELSGAPRLTIHETAAELERHLEQLRSLSEIHGVRWLWLGAQPVYQPAEIGFMPKGRYRIMRNYLPTRGARALHMMQATSTVQANVDFASEDDMARKLRTAMGLGSLVGAIFGNSPLQSGAPCGKKSFRSAVWEATDPDRQGLLDFALRPEGPTYEEYVRYALGVPVFFIVRDETLIPLNGTTFQSFWDKGFQGHEATMADWDLHLSTLFPDARIKTYLETRTADTVPPALIPALPALWKGILYDGGALDAAWDLVKGWTMDARWEHRQAAAREGLMAATPGSRAKTSELAMELLKIAQTSLKNQATQGGYEDEGIYLEPIIQLTQAGRSPADDVLDQWQPGLSSAALLERLSDTFS